MVGPIQVDIAIMAAFGPDEPTAGKNLRRDVDTVPCSVPNSARNARTIRTAAAFSSGL
jgi:hypothetical protein